MDKWIITYTADCEGDWFAPSANEKFYDTFDEAAEAAREAYFGEDENGARAYAEALRVSDIDEFDDPWGIDIHGPRIVERREIDLGDDDIDENWITWRVEPALDPYRAHIAGEHEEYGKCLWSVNRKGEYWIVAHDTDGDFDGDGWPDPPAELIRKARELAR